MALTYNPANWYYLVAGNPTHVYSSARAAYVPVTDATYAAWVASGGVARQMPSQGALVALLGAQYPAGMPVPVAISSLAFRQLFAAAEMTAIYVAAHAAMGQTPPDPTLQIWIDDLSSAPLVAFGNPMTIAGIGALVAAGLITSARATAILSNQAPPAS